MTNPVGALLTAFSTKDLVKEIGVHHDSICSWKNGSQIPAPIHVPKIAKAVGKTIDEVAAAVAEAKALRYALRASRPAA